MSELSLFIMQEKNITCNDREFRIIAHYEREIVRHHLDPITARERCLADISGSNIGVVRAS